MQQRCAEGFVAHIVANAEVDRLRANYCVPRDRVAAFACTVRCRTARMFLNFRMFNKGTPLTG